ncbi:acyl-CoA dehydrogenase family protein [Atopococcus tabaci]|uniref:acyl-CoA dehydrogenase FadE n=1 Tax=Atopococcus tabaci TaxID=269774 RepID=UPI003C6CC385
MSSKVETLKVSAPRKAEILKELYPEDLFGYSHELTDGEVEVLRELRTALEKHLRPVVNEYYEKGVFPFDEFYKVVNDINFMGDDRLFEGRENKLKTSELFNMFLYLELARFDASVATFYTVHGGLCLNTILVGGTEEQINEIVPKLRSFEYQGCFALTEPDHGSDIAGGLATSARREGDKWILNGEKRWIGGADTADIIPVFARDTEDNKIKCFIVRKGTPGYKAEVIQEKGSLRMIHNNHITLENVEVPETDRLPNIRGFKSVNDILTFTRADIAHLAMGVTAGSFAAAHKYVTQREQFNKKLASFQLVQEKLVRMQSNVVANLAYSVQISKMQEEGNQLMTNSALAKMHNSLNMRETVALGREICGGNGITLDADVIRFFLDAEAVYTYEGTHEINALIVGRAITGIGAF